MLIAIILSVITLVSGVDMDLASHRAEAISDVRYGITLKFSKKEATVTGHLDLLFNIEKREDVVLDFREGEIEYAVVNGKKCCLKSENGHIVIAKRTIQHGRNRVEIGFKPDRKALNIREEYMYTLLVPDKASMMFPCFDQPDIKGRFKLCLEIPDSEWIAVSNGAIERDEVDAARKRKVIFAETEPLPTYLFAFAAGKFEKQEFATGKHKINLYYRETDPERLTQLEDIYNEVDYSLQWLDEYTGIPYPFAKYDLVILPGFQFGGMEHSGATFYNDERIFLPQQPTQKERLQRAELIAHETAHMWFGDAVTMRWFNDVWMKEVFANFFAARITEPLFPEIDHQLNFLRAYQRPAIEQDRTDGRTAIRQNLETLNDASLIYNNIIYDKAPVMMKKLVKLMGEDTFRKSMNIYLERYMYGNASWPELVDIMDSVSSMDVRQFAGQWVDNPYWPTRMAESWKDGYDIYYYGYTAMSDKQIDSLADSIMDLNDAEKMAAMMTLHENWLHNRITTDRYLEVLTGMLACGNELICITALEDMNEPLRKAPSYGNKILEIALLHKTGSVRTSAWRLLTDITTTDSVTEVLYDEWKKCDSKDLSERDYMTMAYELAVRMPERGKDICTMQRARISNPDRLQEFDFIAPAAYGSESMRDSLFFVFLQDAQNRKIETWVCRLLYYLNHPLRQEHAIRYIYPALEMMPEIHRTGAIFFPERWCKSLLKGHNSEDARKEFNRFIIDHPDMNPLLLNKIKEAGHRLKL